MKNKFYLQIGIVVIDELHLLGENGGRGATLECLLTKIMHVKSSIHVVGMSATIGNVGEISAFLNAELYVQNFRPVDIKEYVKCENNIWLVDTRLEEILTDKKIIKYKVSDLFCKFSLRQLSALLILNYKLLVYRKSSSDRSRFFGWLSDGCSSQRFLSHILFI